MAYKYFEKRFEERNWKTISEKLKEKRMQDHVALTRKAKQDRMQHTESSILRPQIYAKRILSLPIHCQWVQCWKTKYETLPHVFGYKDYPKTAAAELCTSWKLFLTLGSCNEQTRMSIRIPKPNLQPSVIDWLMVERLKLEWRVHVVSCLYDFVFKANQWCHFC